MWMFREIQYEKLAGVQKSSGNRTYRISYGCVLQKIKSFLFSLEKFLLNPFGVETVFGKRWARRKKISKAKSVPHKYFIDLKCLAHKYVLCHAYFYQWELWIESQVPQMNQHALVPCRACWWWMGCSEGWWLLGHSVGNLLFCGGLWVVFVPRPILLAILSTQSN